MENDASQPSTQALIQGWTDLIQRVEWDHFHSLTFRPARLPSTVRQALRRFREYTDALGGQLGDSVPFFAVAETGPHTRTNVHAFTHGTGGLDTDALRARWRERNGHADINPYDHERPAARYAAKLAGEGAEKFDMDTNRAADKLLRKNA